MRDGNREMLKAIWSKMWPAAFMLYISYFLYRWIGVYISRQLGQISDFLIYQGTLPDWKWFGELAVTFLCTLFLLPAVDYLTNVFVFRKGLSYEASVIGRVFRRDYGSFLTHHSGEWMSKISGEPLQYRQMAVITPTRIAADCTVFIIAAAALIQADLLLGILLTVGVWVSVSIQILWRKSSNRFLEENRDYQDEVKRYQIEMTRAHSFWKSYGCQESLPKKMRALYQGHYDRIQKREYAFVARTEFLQRAVVIILFVGSLFYGLVRIEQGRMTAGSFVSVYFLILQVRIMADSILSNVQLLRGYRALEGRMKELIQGEEQSGAKEIGEWEQLSFQKVSFFYPGTKQGMPERDFLVRRGEAVKLAGENGSGKTTLLKLLCGLFPGENDKIMVDECPLAELDITCWREQIGYVQQFPDIFPGTVEENVRIGNWRATQAQVDEVLEKVGLKKMSARCLKGTREELSGGEIKRIELGRILLRGEQCRLLLLDEPFENLDACGRETVEELLRYEHVGKVLVSHENHNVLVADEMSYCPSNKDECKAAQGCCFC